ncbi:MAG: hypothetical protein RMY35_032325 [Nostoc sp. DedSLP01]|nr:hypothetical protein [Nostoc sp. DedSLP05]MDZ8103159.1 hypothetical protein [Nostoc sp. DedSLP01]
MTNKNSETKNIPEPDPSWGYYITYHTLLKAKSQLNQLIEEISHFEEETVPENEYVEEHISKILKTLNSTLPKIETE